MNSDATTINPKPNLRLIQFGRGIVGILFLFSAVSKLMSVGQFEIIILQQHIIDNRLIAAYLARGVIILELFLGLSFFQNRYLKSLIYPATFIVISLFTLHLIYLITFTEYSENCGCFGELIKMSPAESVAKNITLLIIVILLWLKEDCINPKKEKPLLLISFALLPMIIVLLAFPINIITKSTVEEATVSDNSNGRGREKISKFSIFNQTKPDGTLIELTTDNCLAAFFSLECDHCKEISEIMGDLSLRIPEMRMYCMFLGKEEQVAGFFEETYSNFPYLVINPFQFFNFIGNAPPRIYSLSDGEILKFWDLDDFDIDEIENHVRSMSQ